jgi:hypothetical protein
MWTWQSCHARASRLVYAGTRSGRITAANLADEFADMFARNLAGNAAYATHFTLSEATWN